MVRPDVRVVHPQRVAARLDALDSGSPKRDPTPAVLLLLLRANGEPVPEQCRSLMEGLDRNSLQWRRAYGDDPIEYSIPDQLPSILQAAGGRPHRTLLADGTRLPWLIGIDLSHKWEADESTLCISLVDPDGLLQGAWCSRHSRNEQIDGARLRPLLRLAAQVVEERDDEPRILVVRDGRLFEGEDHRAYLELLGAASSLVECIKGGNPQLFLSTARGAQLPDRAMWAAVPNACSGFLVPFPQRSRKALDRVLKIRCRPEWDGLGLGATGVAECLMASTFAPGLGLKRRTLPAPIYWADGIAGADDSDLRFRGQRVVFVE